jgi:hypothetical protein
VSRFLPGPGRAGGGLELPGWLPLVEATAVKRREATGKAFTNGGFHEPACYRTPMALTFEHLICTMGKNAGLAARISSVQGRTSSVRPGARSGYYPGGGAALPRVTYLRVAADKWQRIRELIPGYGGCERPSSRDWVRRPRALGRPDGPAQVKPPPETAPIAGLLSSDSDARVGHRSSGESCPGPR